MFRTYQTELESLKSELADDSYRRKYAVSMDLFSRYQETFLKMCSTDQEFDLTSQLVTECQFLIEKMAKATDLFKHEESVLLEKLDTQTSYSKKIEAEMADLRAEMLEFENKLIVKDNDIAKVFFFIVKNLI